MHLGTILFEIESLGTGVSRGFQEVFSTADAMLFRQSNKDWERCG